MAFSWIPVSAGVTIETAAQLNEVKTNTDTLTTNLGVAAYSWSEMPVQADEFAKQVQIQELQDALDYVDSVNICSSENTTYYNTVDASQDTSIDSARNITVDNDQHATYDATQNNSILSDQNTTVDNDQHNTYLVDHNSGYLNDQNSTVYVDRHGTYDVDQNTTIYSDYNSTVNTSYNASVK